MAKPRDMSPEAVEKRRDYQRAYRAANKERLRERMTAMRAEDREKYAARSRAYHHANKEVLAAKAKVRRDENAEAYAERRRKYNRENRAKVVAKIRERRWGVTQEMFDRLLAEQDGVCKICRQLNKSGHALSIDHDHETDQFRGLLCSPCNTGLGQFQDNPELLLRAIAYLREPRPDALIVGRKAA